MSLRTRLAPNPTPTSRAAIIGASSTPTAAWLGTGSYEVRGSVPSLVDALVEPVLEPWLSPKEPEVDVINGDGTGGR